VPDDLMLRQGFSEGVAALGVFGRIVEQTRAAASNRPPWSAARR